MCGSRFVWSPSRQLFLLDLDKPNKHRILLILTIYCNIQLDPVECGKRARKMMRLIYYVILNYFNYPIKKTFIVLCPGGRRKFDFLHYIGKIFTSFGVLNMDFNPIGTAFTKAIGQIAAIFGEGEFGQGNGAIFGKSIGIQKNLRLCIESRLTIENTK